MKLSDKCKGLVLMDKADYLNKSHAILKERNNYESIDKNPVPKLQAETKRIFKAVTNDKLPEETIKELTTSDSRTPFFLRFTKRP